MASLSLSSPSDIANQINYIFIKWEQNEEKLLIHFQHADDDASLPALTHTRHKRERESF